jgi:hypothetical protein
MNRYCGSLGMLAVFGAGFVAAWFLPSLERSAARTVLPERPAAAVNSLPPRPAVPRLDFRALTSRAHSSTARNYLAIYRSVRDHARGDEQEARRLLELLKPLKTGEEYAILNGLAVADPHWLIGIKKCCGRTQRT